ncbi:G-type lectin S-receptor-like serine/threonine-protein kinase SD2-5 [Elaeis guineensis]|uniref:Receptor-like serine/threonine-protein kinase n=1 Tax=Elaeis guineensis var. tenera TaxID=51953 RepID=A0A8N4F6E8_ELAGV|nr:G-type lectin S-receptor-like serine/threonine-protein kinase SD2-5 [Elaeis guineensis]
MPPPPQPAPPMRSPYRFLLLFLAILPCLRSVDAQSFDYPTAGPSTFWTNNLSLKHNVTYPDGSMVRAILLRSNPAFFGPSFSVGFFCNAACDAFLLAVFIVYTNSGALITNPMIGSPQVVWSANRDRPVRENATLHFTEAGNLVLRDADSTIVWSTNTSGRSVLGMNITASGNLLLFDRKNASIWQSFDHPTDSLVPGQTLREGQRLIANISTTNWTRGQFYLTVLADGLRAFVDSSPPQVYYIHGFSGPEAKNKSAYVTFTNGSLEFFASFTKPGVPDENITLPSASSVQYMRLESDGHLKLYEWGTTGWNVVDDVMKLYPDNCAYPTVCGEYGICSNNGQCSCPSGISNGSNYFRQINDRQPSLGCSPVTPLSCQSLQDHQLLALKDVTYFSSWLAVEYGTYFPSVASFNLKNEESCQQACLKNCSCKAAIFQYGQNTSDGSCFLPSQLFSLMNNQPTVTHQNSTLYVKVQIAPKTTNGTSISPTSKKKVMGVGAILGFTIGALFAVFLIVGLFVLFMRLKNSHMEEEDQFDQVPGMPTRFSFEELKVATENFCKKLGEGGFGSVFEGKLDDMRVAVKRLDGVGQGRKEFLAEVETIGSIHHIYLVRLIGFCAEKSYRLLVYEYMCNGSLDKWIFYRNQDIALDWQTRCRIITHIAKGLSYLHEECRQRIAHLDIKPQNILLDDNFNAKVSDFGLAKMIDRDQSHVMTRMRGTPGYLAPEWLTSRITEKVDIYSFGVVVMEIVCGRKNLDYSQPEESIHLISLLQEKVKEDRLLDLIDNHSNDMHWYREEVIKIMQLAMWCLQIDSNKRPSMSTVVKVLEGAINVETCLDYNFVATTPVMSSNTNHLDASPPQSASLLSGPR